MFDTANPMRFTIVRTVLSWAYYASWALTLLMICIVLYYFDFRIAVVYGLLALLAQFVSVILIIMCICVIDSRNLLANIYKGADPVGFDKQAKNDEKFDQPNVEKFVPLYNTPGPKNSFGH